MPLKTLGPIGPRAVGERVKCVTRYEHDRGAYRSTPDTAAIFATYPAPHLSWAGGAGDQLLGSALLLLCICAITDQRNMNVSNLNSSTDRVPGSNHL
jgi:glycerol uptake facilitator-like aquaporin